MKFTPAEKLQIITEHTAAGLSIRALAKKYNVATGTIFAVVTGNKNQIEQNRNNLYNPAEIKQQIKQTMLDNVHLFQKHITPGKLKKESAHHLVNMQRESVYTAGMIDAGGAPGGPNSLNQLIQIIVDSGGVASTPGRIYNSTPEAEIVPEPADKIAQDSPKSASEPGAPCDDTPLKSGSESGGKTAPKVAKSQSGNDAGHTYKHTYISTKCKRFQVAKSQLEHSKLAVAKKPIKAQIVGTRKAVDITEPDTPPDSF